MKRPPPRATRTATLFPYTTLILSRMMETATTACTEVVRKPNLLHLQRCFTPMTSQRPRASTSRKRSELPITRSSIGCHEFLARRSEEHTSELQSLMRISYAVFCLKKKTDSSQRAQFRTNIQK